MMDESLFLIADVDLESAADGPADWVAETDAPYKSVDPIDVKDELKQELFEEYKTTYKSLGESLHIQEENQLFNYNRWILIRDEKGTLKAFILFKTTPWGMKMVACGTDGSAEGKQAMLSLVNKSFHVNGVYGEVSPPLENSLKKDAPKVKAHRARKVLGKKITPRKDGYHYSREIRNIGRHEKLLVGRPLTDR